MLWCGSDPIVSDNNGRTPLHYAYLRFHSSIVRLLIEVGASIFSAKVAVKALRGKFGTKSQSTIDKINSIKSADEAELTKRIKAADESAKANPEIAERLIKDLR